MGRGTDERQIIWTAVAIAETGQLAQALGHDFTYVTADGRAVSRYGMGMSLAEVPAAMMAPLVEGRLGPGSSQPLFLVAPLLLVLASAGLAAAAARSLGGNPVTAALLCGIGSPLAAYAATAFSEPLQAAALIAGFFASLRSADASSAPQARHWAWISGASASVGLLAKSSLVFALPAALLPLVSARAFASRRFRVGWAAVGALPGAILWAWFEYRRFGRPFASYPGESFTHPFLDGFWRLVVGPNYGLVLFFPPTLLALWLFLANARTRNWDSTVRVLGCVAPFVILTALAASWWAWHGVWGWGPRLIVPAVPLLAAGAAVVVAPWRPLARAGLVTLSVVVALPGLLQHAVPITNYVTSLTWPKTSAAVAQSLAGYAWERDAHGTYLVSPDHVLATVPQASAFVVFPWFLHAVWAGDPQQAASRLATPPWSDVRPDIVPRVSPLTPGQVQDITGFARWRFWGRGFVPSAEDAQYAAVYDEALADQIYRLQQERDGPGALRLALKLVQLAPGGGNDALVLESYRISGNRAGAADYLAALSRERRAAPAINVVLSLFERDASHPDQARAFLASVADRYAPDSPLQEALNQPIDKWPPNLLAMLTKPVKAAGE